MSCRGSLAMFAAIRRASSLLSSLTAYRPQLPKSAGPRHRWVFGSLYRFPPQLPKVAVVVAVVASAREEVTVAASAREKR